MNCRACHGDSVAGDGPMADGFKLRPINFTDNGTIETIVEGYTFWRVTNGGPGLADRGDALGLGHAGVEAEPDRGAALEDHHGGVRPRREDAANSGGTLMLGRSIAPEGLAICLALRLRFVAGVGARRCFGRRRAEQADAGR